LKLKESALEKDTILPFAEETRGDC